MSEPDVLRQLEVLAREAFQEAYRLQMAGELDAAIRAYQESISLSPTAEAHTFLGWTYSLKERLEEAIAECHEAIAVDPAFGNPYNDIGAYLLQLGQPSEAIPWLEKARVARRYASPHYPLCNLGRAYEMLGRFEEAKLAYQGVLDLEPGYPAALEGLRRLQDGSAS